MRREAARREMEEERAEQEMGRRTFLDAMAKGDNLASAQVQLKKSSARRSEVEKQKLRQAAQLKASSGANPGIADNGSAGFTFAGLKPVVKAEPEKPYDPFDGMSEARTWYTLQPNYPTPHWSTLRKDQAVMAGGYDFREYFSESLLSAFAGFGVFVEDEVAGREAAAAGDAVSTEAAAVAAAGGDVTMKDDPF